MGLQAIPSLGLGAGYVSFSGVTAAAYNSPSNPDGTPLTPLNSTTSSFDATAQTLAATVGLESFWLNNTIFGMTYGTIPGYEYSPQNHVDHEGNVYPATGTVTTVGGVTTVTLPLFLDVYIVLTDGIAYDDIISGQIVASTVPEPSTIILAGVGLVAGSMLIFHTRRRLRKA